MRCAARLMLAAGLAIVVCVCLPGCAGTPSQPPTSAPSASPLPTATAILSAQQRKVYNAAVAGLPQVQRGVAVCMNGIALALKGDPSARQQLADGYAMFAAVGLSFSMLPRTGGPVAALQSDFGLTIQEARAAVLSSAQLTSTGTIKVTTSDPLAKTNMSAYRNSVAKTLADLRALGGGG